MIEVTVLQALEDISFGKNETFRKGDLYFARHSKNGDLFLVRSYEGNWVSFLDYKISGYRWYHTPKGFDRKATIYMKNRKRLNEFFSVEHYFEGGNAKKWWYTTTFKDIKLYE